MATFYICRHGETENNRAGRLQGWIDAPLTEDGLKPTQKVIAKLQGIPIDEIYSSDLGRAFVTAYHVARGLNFPKEIISLPGLREVNYGEAANMKTVEAYKLYPRLDRDTHFVPPNGESLNHMQARVIETVSKLNDKSAGETILFVAHSGVMAALRSSYTGQDFGEHNISEAYAHDFVAKFTVADGKITSFVAV
jgi:2,3-bisphosphoglycerate-dependent phosphoglycerate mutase